jgi:hypothetical protein
MSVFSTSPVDSVSLYERNGASEIHIKCDDKTYIDVVLNSGQFKYHRDINDVLQCLVGNVIEVVVKKFTNPDENGRFGWVKFSFDNQRITLQAYFVEAVNEDDDYTDDEDDMLYIDAWVIQDPVPYQAPTPEQLLPWDWKALSYNPPINWNWPNNPVNPDYLFWGEDNDSHSELKSLLP